MYVQLGDDAPTAITVLYQARISWIKCTYLYLMAMKTRDNISSYNAARVKRLLQRLVRAKRK
jgi:hypothetical protein